MLGDAEIARQLLQRLAQRPLAEDHQPGRVLAAMGGERPDQRGVVLLRHQPADRDVDGRRAGRAPGIIERLVGAGGEVGRDHRVADHLDAPARQAGAAGHVVGHPLGHRHDVVGRERRQQPVQRRQRPIGAARARLLGQRVVLADDEVGRRARHQLGQHGGDVVVAQTGHERVRPFGAQEAGERCRVEERPSRAEVAHVEIGRQGVPQLALAGVQQQRGPDAEVAQPGEQVQTHALDPAAGQRVHVEGEVESPRAGLVGGAGARQPDAGRGHAHRASASAAISGCPAGSHTCSKRAWSRRR